MAPQSAIQLQNLIGVRGSVMIFRAGRAVEVDRCIRTMSGFYFSGILRDGSNIDFEVTQEHAYDPQFVVTSKARVNWPW